MSPYRVLASHPNYTESVVLGSMLSVDKVTQDRNIYIIIKAVPNDPNTPMTSKAIAHLQSGKQNSVILDKYQIVKNYEGRQSYKVRHCGVNPSIIDGEEWTQQDCLQLAMHDYCMHHGITIINTL